MTDATSEDQPDDALGPLRTHLTATVDALEAGRRAPTVLLLAFEGWNDAGEAIRDSGRFTQVEANETLVRGWHLDGLAVRPDHRMVAHTGFLLTARRLASGEEALRLKKRSKVSEFRAEDVEAWQPADEARWTPEALGERPITDKKARKAAKEARLMAARSRAAEQGVDAYGGRTPTGEQD